MSAALHRFPKPGEGPKPPELAAPPGVEMFDAERGTQLLTVARDSLGGADRLLDFVHQNRDLARHAGIETIAIELVAILQGDRFSRVIDALEETAKTGQGVALTPEGLAILRRVEALVAEAFSNIRKFSEGDFSAMEIVESRARREAEYQRAHLELEERRLDDLRKELGVKHEAANRQAETIYALRSALGQTKPASAAIPSQRSSVEIWVPFAIFGVIAVTATVIALVAGKK